MRPERGPVSSADTVVTQGVWGLQPVQDGSRLAQAMMTVAATLELTHSCLASLCDVTAARDGEPPPSLRPTPRELTKSMCPAA